MKCIIIAAGDATRWNNHLGVPKHLIQINGEPILHRTVRLLHENGCNDITVVGPDDNRYRINNSELFIPTKNPAHGGVDKFLNSKSLWSTTNRTVVLYGDVYFSENAIKTIVHYTVREWKLFCSFEKGEIFAQSFYPEHIEKHLNGLMTVVEQEQTGKISCVGGWTHYRRMCDISETFSNQNHGNYGNCVVIEDETDDFDYPVDYDNFILRLNRG